MMLKFLNTLADYVTWFLLQVFHLVAYPVNLVNDLSDTPETDRYQALKMLAAVMVGAAYFVSILVALVFVVLVALNGTWAPHRGPVVASGYDVNIRNWYLVVHDGPNRTAFLVVDYDTYARCPVGSFYATK